MRSGVAVALAAVLALASASPLYDYVHTFDPHYSYYDTGIRINNGTNSGWTGYLLNMTSQAWLDSSLVDHVVWTHQLVVVIPDTIRYNGTAVMYITGGDNKNPGPPSADDEDLLCTAIIAMANGVIGATLYQVPNAPIVFSEDPNHEERSEDALVAFSFYQFVNNQSNPHLVVYMAMVKAAVAALTTIENYAPQHGLSATSFIIAGASKRGWTTWLTSAVDNRVIGAVPIVMDFLHFQANMHHMFKAYGGWTFAFTDYYALNFTRMLGTNPEGMAALMAIVDPINYVANMTMPKMIVDATGDEFFMPDDDYYWWGQLEGESYRLIVANAEHSFATGIPTLLPSVVGFAEGLLAKATPPSFTWDIDATSGAITIVSKTQPAKVVMRFATTMDGSRRDFRLIKGNTPLDPCKSIPIHVFGSACLNLVLWDNEDVGPVSVVNGVYTYVLSQPLPEVGWRGFLGELWFAGPNGKYWVFTTQVSIIPNTFPFPDCSGDGCYGGLV